MPSKLITKQKHTHNPYDSMSMEELVSQLTPEELKQLHEEVDIDNDLIPPSQRCKNQTDKVPTEPFDREKLLQFLEEASKNEGDWEKNKPFVKALRGKKYQPKGGDHTDSAVPVSSKPPAHIDLDMEEDLDELLRNASEEELIDLAAVLGFTGLLTQEQMGASLEKKPQQFGGFNSVVKPPNFKILPDEAPNNTDIEDSIRRLQSNDAKLEELNLNNIQSISTEQFERLWASLEKNSHLQKLHCANTQLNNVLAEPLLEVLRENGTLRVVNLESNYLTSDFVVKLLHAIDHDGSQVSEVRLCNQRQRVLGVQVEQEITKKVLANPRLLRLGVDLVTADAQVRIQAHLTENLDQKTRVKRRSKSQER